MEKARALRCAQPLVSIPAVEVGSERGEVRRNVGGCVSAVDHRHEALRAGARDDLLDRQHEPRVRGDVADVDDSGVFGGRREDCVADLPRVIVRQRDRRPDVARAGASAGPLPREVTGVVLEVGREHLVAGTEVERTGSEVDAGRGVLDEGEVAGEAADVVRESCSRRVEEGGKAAVEKVDGSLSSVRCHAW
jgi:hypothetical protein